MPRAVDYPPARRPGPPARPAGPSVRSAGPPARWLAGSPTHRPSPPACRPTQPTGAGCADYASSLRGQHGRRRGRIRHGSHIGTFANQRVKVGNSPKIRCACGASGSLTPGPPRKIKWGGRTVRLASRPAGRRLTQGPPGGWGLRGGAGGRRSRTRWRTTGRRTRRTPRTRPGRRRRRRALSWACGGTLAISAFLSVKKVKIRV
jgi:hypothetical protein